MVQLDRTADFFAAVEAGGGQPQNSGLPATLDRPSTLVQSKSEFAKAAAQISKGISETTEKLQHLAHMARQRSPFDGGSNDISGASYVIKTNLQRLNQDLDTLDTYVANQRSRSKSAHQSQHSSAILTNLRTQLADTTKNFSTALTTRTKNIQQQSTRRKVFESNATTEKRRPKRDLHAFENLMGGSPRSSSHNASQQPLFEEQQQQQQQHHIEIKEDYHESRLEAVDDIQSMLGELGTMYSRLAGFVESQGEDINRIDSNVSGALVSLTAAEKELDTALARQRSSQWLVVKVFGVLLTFAMFFVMFVA